MGSKKAGGERFRISELAAILETNPRQVEGWVEQGFLKPAVPGRGPGRPSYFNYTNLLQGVLTLEFQRTFGAKTPVWGRIAGRVAKTRHAARSALVSPVADHRRELRDD